MKASIRDYRAISLPQLAMERLSCALASVQEKTCSTLRASSERGNSKRPGWVHSI